MGTEPVSLSNNPPVEISREDAEFALSIMERDMAQGLHILTHRDSFSEEGIRKVVGMMEEIRPVRDRLKEALK